MLAMIELIINERQFLERSLIAKRSKVTDINIGLESTRNLNLYFEVV